MGFAKRPDPVAERRAGGPALQVPVMSVLALPFLVVSMPLYVGTRTGEQLLWEAEKPLRNATNGWSIPLIPRSCARSSGCSGSRRPGPARGGPELADVLGRRELGGSADGGRQPVSEQCHTANGSVRAWPRRCSTDQLWRDSDASPGRGVGEHAPPARPGVVRFRSPAAQAADAPSLAQDASTPRGLFGVGAVGVVQRSGL